MRLGTNRDTNVTNSGDITGVVIYKREVLGTGKIWKAGFNEINVVPQNWRTEPWNEEMKLVWKRHHVDVFEAQLPLAIDWAGAARLGPTSPQQSATPQPLDRAFGLLPANFKDQTFMIMA
jgi:hypothetical protein